MSGDRDDDRDKADETGAGATGRGQLRQAADGALRAPSVTVFPLSALRQKSAPAETRSAEPSAADAEGTPGGDEPTVFPLADPHGGRMDAGHDDESARELGASPGLDNDADASAEMAGRDESAGDDKPQRAEGDSERPRPAPRGSRWEDTQPRTLEEAQRNAEALIALEKTILSLLREPGRDAPKPPVERPVFGAEGAGGSGQKTAPREIKIFRPPAAPADRPPRPLIPSARFGDGGADLSEQMFRGGPRTPPERILPASDQPFRAMRVPFEIEPILPRLVHEIDALPEVEPPEEAPPAPKAPSPIAEHEGRGAAAAASAEPGEANAGQHEPIAPAARPRPEPQPRGDRAVEPVRPAPVLVADNTGLAVDGIGKRFKQRQVLRGVSLTLQRGEVVGLLGPNGAGKTTCFYIITGLISADYGSILLDDKDITGLPMYRRARLGIGYLPQEPSIFRGLNVEKNIRAVLESVESERDAREARLDDLLAEFSITHLRRTPALALSGGERRRVEIARALALQPNFILLDEPLAGIDPIALGDIRDLVAHLKDRGIGVLITDHNVRETLEIVDRAYIIYNGEVLMSGKPSEIVSHDDVRRVYLGDGFTL